MTAQMELAEYAGRVASEACADKAECVSDFDVAAACDAVVKKLESVTWALSGEDLTEHCLALGIEPHDRRAFGQVFQRLSRAGIIRSTGYTKRRHGNGTGGANLWILTVKGAA